MAEGAPLLQSYEEEEEEEAEVVSISSGENRAVRQSFITGLGNTSPSNQADTVNSDDDFGLQTVNTMDMQGETVHQQRSNNSMVTVTRGSPSPLHQQLHQRLSPCITTVLSTSPQPSLCSPPHPVSSPPHSVSPVVVVHGCPCQVESCSQKCCEQKVRTMHRARLEKVNSQTQLIREHNTRERKNSTSSYGSLDSINESPQEGQLLSPVASINRGESMNLDGGVEVRVIQRSSSMEEIRMVRSPNMHCGCHKPVVDHTTRKAVLKLVIASLIALLFMVGEVLGGYFANSLAIMTDAAHMLSDFAGFLISLFAIWVSRRPPSRGMSFGWHRAEVIGALVSVLLIWVLTGVLFYAAVRRVIHQDFEVDADVMLITACIGVFVNVFMCMVLGHGHGHSHGGKGGHGHSHNSGRSHAEEEEEEGVAVRRRRRTAQNINVRAAFIHVLGDIIQSIGVVIAGYIIWIWPSLKLADPICTFIFCVLVLISTFNILKDALRVVMEGTPKNIDYEEVKADLINRVKGVRQAHSLHIWSLTLDKTALAAHLVLEEDAKGDEVLGRANQMLRERHQITTTTLQVEGYQQVMDECGPCQEPERTGVLQGLLPSCCLRQKKECQPQSE